MSKGQETPDEPNPYHAGQDSHDAPPAGGRPSTDPSIEFEPHLLNQYMPVDDGELQADLRIAREAEDPTGADAIEHTVWDEPALSGDLSGAPPEDQLTYARWLEQRIAETTSEEAWRTTLLIVLAAGPWGVLGALMAQMSGSGVGFGGFFAAAILAPVTEEITKVAAALWVVEKRPFLFKSTSQILVCAMAGGLAFAAIENVMYLFFYSPGGGPAYAAWRWIVCTGLHVTCSTIAGVGLARIWRDAIDNRRRPELAVGMPLFAAAMILHGLYNAAVTLAEAAGILTFQ